ncbi:uncharacterized protein LOC105784204 [Gossypium raimondii]|uniref:Peptidase M48 domain-containing protein n=2 Tax=Gossypium raimondii TaxID=29730 RepID=A0A0D2LUU8_GOSRA|nr:uncharacterized protein LOC105784204 [Gossypium raimondii]KJB07837.1 hypothetical protein B456_001G047100 [Gossypium raimondii]
MPYCRRAKLMFNTLRSSFISRPIFSSPIRDSSSIISRNLGSSVSSSTRAKFSGLSSYSSISRRLGISSNNYTYDPFLNGAKRFYYVDWYGVQHFRRRGQRRWIHWNPRKAMIIVLVGSGVLVTVYFGNLETVPYTKRKHLVLLSEETEKQMGESQFEELKAAFKGKILPAIHPESVRVTLIAKHIIESLQRGLSHDQIWSDLEYASPESSLEHESVHDTMAALSEKEGNLGINWSREDEILDDKWVQRSRKSSQVKGSQPTTSHLEGLNWEVLVVNEPVVNAICLPGGKIVVFRGLLEHLRTDAEIAAIIGHEVGHTVARHIAETITKDLWLDILQLILYQFIMPDLADKMSALLLRLPFSRRMELEADYIGLLLLACAGYDPRVAPKVFEKLGKVAGDSPMQDYLSTHPSGRKRAQLLAQTQVMEEALVIYQEVSAGRGVEGFL